MKITAALANESSSICPAVALCIGAYLWSDHWRSCFAEHVHRIRPPSDLQHTIFLCKLCIPSYVVCYIAVETGHFGPKTLGSTKFVRKSPDTYNFFYSLAYNFGGKSECSDHLMPNTHRRRRRDETRVASRRRRRCELWTQVETSSRRLPTDSVDNLETGQIDSIAVWLREFWSILITFSTMTT